MRLSEHFILADFLGCHSVYSKGYQNVMADDADADFKLENGRTLCAHILEPVLAGWGPVSISYGFISSELSRQIVKYQDPDKPSHHMWSLGAAADVCVHDWVNHDSDEYAGSPISFAFGVEEAKLPYSRMITYSESPYVCLAASASEVDSNRPRKAFYENRFTGKPKIKPDYRQYATDQAKARAHRDAKENGLTHGWRGAGYPTHHGGGFQQYHHMRVSNYTMVSDWLIDLKSISNGAKNIPSLNKDEVQDAFAAAGVVYDRMLELSGALRLSIIAGYVSHLNPNFDPDKDWRSGYFHFEVVPPGSMSPTELAEFCGEMEIEGLEFEVDPFSLHVWGNTDVVLSQTAW